MLQQHRAQSQGQEAKGSREQARDAGGPQLSESSRSNAPTAGIPPVLTPEKSVLNSITPLLCYRSRIFKTKSWD